MKRFYFAYGSNLSDEDRAAHQTPCPPGAFKKVGLAFLPDRRLGFTRKSKTRAGGVLDVVPCRGCVAAGVIYEVTAAGWAWLNEKEGCPRYYRHLDTVALTPDGGSVPVRTYEVADRETFVRPNKAYLDVCRKAYEDHDLDTTALEAAAAHAPATPVTAFFVYGTLMRGESRHGVFADHGAQCILLAKAFGRLFDCGAYPAMKPPPGGGLPMVHGEFIRVQGSSVSSLIESLDSVEGFRGFDAHGSLFERRLVDVDVGEGHIRRAWAYVMPTVPDDAVAIPGDWRARQGRRGAFLDKLVAGHRVHQEELAIARKIVESSVAWGERDVEAEARALLPLVEALDRGDTSERKLAQMSGIWVVMIE